MTNSNDVDIALMTLARGIQEAHDAQEAMNYERLPHELEGTTAPDPRGPQHG